MPKKFPSLYTIIKNDDISTLTDFFTQNPGYNEENTLAKGMGLRLLEEAIHSHSIQCCIFLINRMNLDQLRTYVDYVVKNYKRNTPAFDHFYTIGLMFAQNQNNYLIIYEILKKLLYYQMVVSEEFMKKLLDSFHLEDFLNNDAERNQFEKILISNKISTIAYFEKYYREKNIDTTKFFVKCLLFSRIKTDNFIKIFKNIDYTQKTKIENPYLEENFISKNEYSIEFIIAITSDYKHFKKLNIFKNNTFEDEFFIMTTELNDILYERIFDYSYNNLFEYLIKSVRDKLSYYSKNIFKHNHLERLNSYLPYLSQKFFDYIQVNIIDKIKDTTHHYYNYTETIENIENIYNNWKQIQNNQNA